jgi:ankyrin repeat protein
MTIIERFWSACSNGDIDAVIRLGEMVTAEDARALNNYAIHTACFHGHLDVVQWLTNHFGISGKFTTDDARGRNNYALLRACANGHLDVAQWCFYRHCR